MDETLRRQESDELRYGPFARHSDDELDDLLGTYGVTARDNSRRFAGLLPEVLRREHYLVRGCPNLYIFAATYGGMRRDHVNEVLRLDRHFERSPMLRALLHTGEVGWSKLRAVAKVLTPETDAIWADHAREMSKHALEQFVRDVKAGRARVTDVPIDGREDLDDRTWDLLDPEQEAAADRRGPPRPHRPLKVPPAVAEHVLSFIEELGRETGRPLGLADGLIRLVAMARSGDGRATRLPAVIVLHSNPQTGDLVERTRQGTVDVPQGALEESYEVIGAVDLEATKPAPVRFDDWTPTKPDGTPTKRPPIPEPIRRWVMLKWGGRCCFPGCHRRATELHHRTPFAANPTHDPDDLVPLCRAHHSIAHHGLIANPQARPREWQLLPLRRIVTEADAVRARVDRKVQERRRPGAIQTEGVPREDAFPSATLSKKRVVG